MMTMEVWPGLGVCHKIEQKRRKLSSLMFPTVYHMSFRCYGSVTDVSLC